MRPDNRDHVSMVRPAEVHCVPQKSLVAVELDQHRQQSLARPRRIGPGRNYSLGACPLDRDDPLRVLARTTVPILQPSPDERHGYVPNVVYSCCAIVQGRDLLISYGVADSFTTFATARVDDLLAAMA
jgi:hypothetical protein